MAGKPKPVRMLVRMYQVGFGDCFLLSFEYAKPLADGRAERHVLIDFGSTHGAPDRPAVGMVPIAKRIREHTGGRLDAIVVSHRHADHLSAFGNDKVVEMLAENGDPSLIVRSWTEDPAAQRDATGGGRGSASARFLAGLNAARSFTEQLAESVGKPGSAAGRRLLAAAKRQMANAEAVQQLAKWGKGKAGEYLHYGQSSRLEDIVPGIGVRVLGPPTIEQYPEVRKDRQEDDNEFWMLYRKMIGSMPADVLAALGEPSGGEAARRQAMAAQVPPGPSRWLIDRLASQQANSFLRIVRILDDALNNTSLILLFEVPSAGGTKRLLFGGDAQIENWEYALKAAPDAEANLELLEQVDLYKVGHHGSRNATPKTLFKLWEKPANVRRDMVALMSTSAKAGHGSALNRSEVPRQTLVTALNQRMRLYNTDTLARDVDFVELTADLAKGGRFKKTRYARPS